MEDCWKAVGRIAGSHLIVHCNAYWENFSDDCEQLALRALEPQGLMARLNPSSLLIATPDAGRHAQEAKQHPSRELFSAAAWTLSPGQRPSLELVQDDSLRACVEAIAAA